MMSLSKEEKLSHLSDLIQMSLIDMEHGRIEEIYIDKVAQSLGIQSEELARLYQKIRSGQKKKRELPDRESEVIPLFHRLLIMMSIDRDIDEKEVELCRQVGLQMGLNLYAVEEALKVAFGGNANDLTPTVVNSIFKKYYN